MAQRGCRDTVKARERRSKYNDLRECCRQTYCTQACRGTAIYGAELRHMDAISLKKCLQPEKKHRGKKGTIEQKMFSGQKRKLFRSFFSTL